MDSHVYAAYCMNDRIRKSSSSGGIYSLIAKKVISEGGYVFAAIYDENLDVVHKKINSEEVLYASMGSKYVESNLNNIFFEVQEVLSNNEKCLFVGTPCQVEGLLSFLKVKRISIEKLICVDLVCHGVPGRFAWRSYISSLKKRGFNLKWINMRDKKEGWSHSNYGFYLLSSENQRLYQHHRDNEYMKGYIAGFYTRPSCHKCQFKGINRNSDITLGDFWGVWDILPEMDDDGGTSLVFVHSIKGDRMFGTIKNLIKYENVDFYIEDIIKRNSCIVYSAQENGKSKQFMEAIQQGKDFIDTINRMKRNHIIQLLKRKLYLRWLIIKNKKHS